MEAPGRDRKLSSAGMDLLGQAFDAPSQRIPGLNSETPSVVANTAAPGHRELTPFVLEVQRDSKAASIRDTQGRFKLHMLCQNRFQDFEVTRFVINAYPAAATRKDRTGSYPLHYMCQNESIKLDCLKVMIDAFPDAASAADSHGSVPIHFLARNEMLSSVHLQVLIDADPGAAGVKNNHDYFPLHYLCMNESQRDRDIQSFHLLLKAFPEAVQIPNANGFFPLHFLCRNRAISLEVLEYTVAAFPDASGFTSSDNKYPVDILCRNPSATVEMVTLLIKTFPHARSLDVLVGNCNDELRSSLNKFLGQLRIKLGRAPDAMELAEHFSGTNVPPMVSEPEAGSRQSSLTEGQAVDVVRVGLGPAPPPVRGALGERAEAPLPPAVTYSFTPAHSFQDSTELDQLRRENERLKSENYTLMQENISLRRSNDELKKRHNLP